MVVDVNKIAECVNVDTGHVEWWLYAIGYVFALIGSFFTRWIVTEMHEGVKRTSGEDRIPYCDYEWQSEIVGYLEAVVYPSAWYLNRPEFIVLWVGLKTVAGWKSWNGPAENIPGRAVFNVFLVGTGLSILFGTIGGLLPTWWGKEEYSLVFLTPIALILGSLLLRARVKNAAASREKGLNK